MGPRTFDDNIRSQLKYASPLEQFLRQVPDNKGDRKRAAETAPKEEDHTMGIPVAATRNPETAVNLSLTVSRASLWLRR